MVVVGEVQEREVDVTWCVRGEVGREGEGVFCSEGVGGWVSV